MNSYAELQNLGSGVLTIDAIGPVCTFDGHSIAPLSIAFELNAWLLEDALKHNIQISELSSARLTVTIDLQRSPAPTNPRGSFYIGKNGMPIDKGEFFRLSAKCESEIKLGGATYSASRNHFEQWPVGWPNT